MQIHYHYPAMYFRMSEHERADRACRYPQPEDPGLLPGARYPADRTGAWAASQGQNSVQRAEAAGVYRYLRPQRGGRCLRHDQNGLWFRPRCRAPGRYLPLRDRDCSAPLQPHQEAAGSFAHFPPVLGCFVF